MKSKINNVSNKKTIRYGGYIIDFVCLLFIATAMTVEILKRYGFGPILELAKRINFRIDLNPTAELIIVLLPTVITVISIVLSLMKEKIYSVSLNDFNRLRGSWFYNFLHMIICTIIIFVLYTVCCIFALKYSIVALDLVAIFFCFYFSIQEIPILLHNERIISRIIRKRFKKRDGTYYLGSQRNERCLTSIVESIILTEGIKTAYKAMSYKRKPEYNKNLLNDLLDIQNRYFWSMREDIEFASLNINGTYREIAILDAIDKGFDNVDELLAFHSDFDYKKIVDDEDETYQLTRSIFSLHNICTEFKLTVKEQEKMREIVNRITLCNFSKGADKAKQHSFISLMLIHTLPADEIWFLEALSNGDYSSFSLFSADDNGVGLFISVLIAYVFKVFAKNDSKLGEFIDRPFNGINGDGKSWKYHVNSAVERMNSKRALCILDSLLKIYESIKSSYFENIFIKGDGLMSSRDGFDKTYIFNAWIEILMFGCHSAVEEDEISLTLETLSDEDKTTLAYFLPTKWIENGSMKKNLKLEFLSYFGDYDVDENWHNKGVIKALDEFHKKYFKEKMDDTAAYHNPDLSAIKSKLIEPFNQFKKDEFFDESIDLSKEILLSYSLRIDSFDCDTLVSAYASSLKNSIEYSIKKQIKEKICKSRTILLSDYKLKTSDIAKIKSLNPSFASNNDYIYFNEEFAEYFSKIRKSESRILPHAFFGKEGSVSFNLAIDSEKTVVRYLNIDEIEHLIEKEYKMINGLYKYSQYRDDEIRSFLVTKEELINYLSKEIKFAVIVFKQKVNLKRGTYLLLRRKNDDE